MSRIIAGLYRGTKLRTPDQDATRPTTERVREALFSALANWFGTHDVEASQQLSGVSVLDLFGGSGAIGLEAASRGASAVVIVEQSQKAAKTIAHNIRQTGSNNVVKLVQGSVAAVLAKPAGKTFDVVWLDPPYDATIEQVNGWLADLTVGWFEPDALVVVERAKRAAPLTWPDQYSDQWVSKHGETVLYFARANQGSK